MKRIVLVLVIAFAFTMAVSAQTYTVQEITGRVERSAGGSRWEPLNVGDTLLEDTVIRTVIGANLTVRIGDELFSIGAMKNGKLIDLLHGDAVIQIQGRVSQIDTEAGERITTRVTTASARASDAAGDLELEE